MTPIPEKPVEWLHGSRYNGLGCGACLHFDECKRVKGVKAGTDYCQYTFNRFTLREP